MLRRAQKLAIVTILLGFLCEPAVAETGFEKSIEASSQSFSMKQNIRSAVGTSADREASKPSISEVSITKPSEVPMKPLRSTSQK